MKKNERLQGIFLKDYEKITKSSFKESFLFTEIGQDNFHVVPPEILKFRFHEKRQNKLFEDISFLGKKALEAKEPCVLK